MSVERQHDLVPTVRTPVALIAFNRPDHTRQVIDRLREVRVERLFVVLDGPRPDRPDDDERCRQVREAIDSIDWDCDVQVDAAATNLGCRLRVSSGLSWLFDQVDRAIVLEDDCVAHPDFFRFCEAMLDRYEDDPRIGSITGDNFQDGHVRGDASYYFSHYPHVWGWATWADRWKSYDVDMPFWKQWKDSDEWIAAVPNQRERAYWRRIFDSAAAGDIDTWDYAWVASHWRHGWLSVTPNVNLVDNIGFDAAATHTKSRTAPRPPAAGPLGVIAHPETVESDLQADRYTFRQQFQPTIVGRVRRRAARFVQLPGTAQRSPAPDRGAVAALDEPAASSFRTCGVRIDAVSLEHAAESIIGGRAAGAVHLCNAYTLSLASKDASLVDVLERSTLNLPDGMPLVWMSRRMGVHDLHDRVYGPDLMQLVLDRGQETGRRHFLYGSTPEVLAALERQIGRRWPAAVIVGTEAPPFRAISDHEVAESVERAAAVAADVVWVGMGTPKQDLLVQRMADVGTATYVAIGAAFDFISGNKRQAPAWMRRTGLEWSYRLVTEPRRLWKRYLVGNTRFALRAVRDIRAANR